MEKDIHLYSVNSAFITIIPFLLYLGEILLVLTQTPVNVNDFVIKMNYSYLSP